MSWPTIKHLPAVDYPRKSAPFPFHHPTQQHFQVHALLSGAHVHAAALPLFRAAQVLSRAPSRAPTRRVPPLGLQSASIRARAQRFGRSLKDGVCCSAPETPEPLPGGHAAGLSHAADPVSGRDPRAGCQPRRASEYLLYRTVRCRENNATHFCEGRRRSPASTDVDCSWR